jgi:hypothetical protein
MGFFGGGGSAAGIGGSTGATDNAILRADGTGAATLQNSAIVIEDAISSFSCTGVASTDIITAVGHNFVSNQGVIFPTLTGGSGLTAATTIYFVRDISGDTFKVSTSSGGSAVNFTTDITAGTVIAIQASVSITNQHSETNSSLILTPKGTGAFIVGPKPDGTTTGGNARGARAIDIQLSRGAANQVAGTDSVAIGFSTRVDATAIGIGLVSGTYAAGGCIAIGRNAQASGSEDICIGRDSTASGQHSIVIGRGSTASGFNSSVIGRNTTANKRSEFATMPFSSLYWSGTTTDATPAILNLDGTATNRFTIAANTAVIANLYIIARRTDTVDKWFSGQRKVAIRRNNANGTAIIGSVETIEADQTEGSPTWSVAITADDTNEALQVEVTGAASETVSWRVMAFYHVV